MPRFGIMTASSQVDYHDVLRVWREADATRRSSTRGCSTTSCRSAATPPDPSTRAGRSCPRWRHRPSDCASACSSPATASGLPRCSPRSPRPSTSSPADGSSSASAPAHDLAIPLARREDAAHGLPFHDFADSVAHLAEACTVIRRLWTEDEPFDFEGTHLHLTGAFCNPKPVQRPHPPVLIGGRSAPLLRVVARHADRWNIAGGDIDAAVARSALLDHFCAEIGRDPAALARSIHLPVAYDRPPATRDAIGRAIDAGFEHIVLGLPAPYPDGVARWVADEFTRPD